MAKIAAIVLPRRRSADLAPLLREMLDALRVGGAPEAGTWTEAGRECCVGLAHVGPDPLNRVSQPVAGADWRCTLAGYLLADDEAAARVPGVVRLGTALADEGDAALPRLDGVFAFAHWDRDEERLLAGVDKLGLRPLYHAEVPGGGYAVASEIKALVALLGDAVRVNWTAWQEQVALGYQLGDHTLIEGIERFAPAQVMTCDGSSRALRVTERFVEEIEERPMGREEFVDANHALFLEAMRRCDRLRDPAERPLLTISGGLDSRRMLGWMLAHGDSPELVTVPLVRPDGIEIESGIVRHLAELLGMTVTRVAPPTGADMSFMRTARDLGCDFETDEHSVYATTALALRRPASVNFDGLAGDTLLNPGIFLSHEFLAEGGDELFLRALVPPPMSVRIPGDLPPLEDRIREMWSPYRGHRNRYTMWALAQRGRRELALGPMMLQANAFESMYPYVERSFARLALQLPPADRIGTLLQRPLIAKLGIAALDDTPSTREARTHEDARFRRSDPGARLDADGRLLRHARQTSSAIAGLGMPAGDRRRVRMARLLWRVPGLALRERRVQWQARKVETVDRMIRHAEAAAAGADSYAAMLEALRGAWGSRTEWVGTL